MTARIFQKLHPFNWPIAFAASLTGRVHYWRTEFLPQVLLRRFKFLDPAEYFSLDQWQDELEAAFVAWQQNLDTSQPAFRLVRQVLDVDVDFSANWQQWLAIQYEERHLFLALVARSGVSPTEIGAAGVDDLFRRVGLPLSNQQIPSGGLLPYLDRVWGTFVCLLYAGRAGFAAVRAPQIPWPTGISVIWSGISASEFAEADDQLDFSFLVQRKLLDPAQQLFFLPAPPGEKTAERLKRSGVQWRLLNEMGATGLEGRTAARIAWTAVRELLRWGDPIRSALAIRFSATSAAWIAVQRRLKARAYLTSISMAWPEGPEVAALKALGLATANWAYSANVFRFAKDRPGFRDLGLLRSISVADELWVWNEEFRGWLEARRTGAKRSVEILGPVMAGDSSWLELDPAVARERFGIRFNADDRYLAIFDVPTVNQRFRVKYGHGPTTAPLDMLSQLYVDMERLLSEDPTWVLVLKPKRSFSDWTREYPESLRRLLNSQFRDRIRLLHHQIDPYIPVAIADAAIGIPFTSPVIAALYSGRTGIFHDPLGQAMSFYPQAYKPLVTHSYADLIENLRASTNRLRPVSIYNDPGKEFATRILNMMQKRALP